MLKKGLFQLVDNIYTNILLHNYFKIYNLVRDTNQNRCNFWTKWLFCKYCRLLPNPPSTMTSSKGSIILLDQSSYKFHNFYQLHSLENILHRITLVFVWQFCCVTNHLFIIQYWIPKAPFTSSSDLIFVWAKYLDLNRNCCQNNRMWKSIRTKFPRS